jgi:hypothetical protein
MLGASVALAKLHLDPNFEALQLEHQERVRAARESAVHSTAP